MCIFTFCKVRMASALIIMKGYDNMDIDEQTEKKSVTLYKCSNCTTSFCSFAAEDIKIDANAAIMVEVNTGKIIYEMDKEKYSTIWRRPQ